MKKYYGKKFNPKNCDTYIDYDRWGHGYYFDKFCDKFNLRESAIERCYEKPARKCEKYRDKEAPETKGQQDKVS